MDYKEVMTPALILNASTALSTEKAIEAIKLSEEQLAIAYAVKNKNGGNILVIARAGTGKTFLIMQCLSLVAGTVAVAAYNNKIASEIGGKIAKAGHRHVKSGTFHSFGARILNALYPKAKCEGRGARNAGYNKMTAILKKLEVPQYLKAFVKKTTSMAMMQGFGIVARDGRAPYLNPKDLDAWRAMVAEYRLDAAIAKDNVAEQMAGGREAVIKEGLRFAYQAMNMSKKMLHEIYSYDDMLWAPLYLDAAIPVFDFVFVDEGQDSNPLRVEWACRMMAKGGRIAFVGDNKQAIYRFTGAMSGALETIRERFNCSVFKMTVTFRCAKAIVRMAQKIVPDYKAADQNPDGIAKYGAEAISIEEFEAMTLVPGQDAIICRNTRPLVELAFNLIRRDIPCRIEGKDVGGNLIAQIRFIDERLKSLVKFEQAMDAYLVKETAKLHAADAEMEAEALTDKIETLRVIMHGLPKGSNMDTVVAKIESLFGDSEENPQPTVVLMTAHKSKGLEFYRVFGWGVATFMPSKMAITADELEQEENLEYVLKTRAIMEFYEVFVPPPPKKDR
jgi:superfamily I DNA/RNA helicase